MFTTTIARCIATLTIAAAAVLVALSLAPAEAGLTVNGVGAKSLIGQGAAAAQSGSSNLGGALGSAPAPPGVLRMRGLPPQTEGAPSTGR